MSTWTQVPAVAERVEQLRQEYDVPTARLVDSLCDRHPEDAVAVRLADADGQTQELTYAELQDASRRMATVLAEKGVGPGDRVATLMGKSRELLETLLATWRLGAVYVPLFTAFSPPAIGERLALAQATVVVVDTDQRHKLTDPHVQILERGEALAAKVESARPWRDDHVSGPDDPFIQIYTSGTTGTPKAVAVPRRALAAFVAYLEFGLDVRAEDTYWNAADPGWAYGLYFAVVAPLAAGRTFLLSTSAFSPETAVSIMETCGVTNFAGAPTMYRAIKQRAQVFPRLRRASSAGEPLTPDVNEWAPGALGCEVRDHWGQTEQGMAVANCWHDLLREPLTPRSMGQALPGFAAEVIDGELVLDTRRSPLMWFGGYVADPERTEERFTADGRWYLTGDTVERDGERFSFVSRADDVIIMAGYRIGPVDIESILTEHPLVTEAAVVGVPDEIRGEVLEAFVVLRDAGDSDGSQVDTAGLADELRQRVREGYGAHAYPRRVHVVPSLPRTPSGKMQRFLLRRREESDG